MADLLKKAKIEKKTYLVTGGTGSIGYEIVKQLLMHDVEKVVVFSRDDTKHFLMKKRIPSERLDTVVGDVREYRSIQRALKQYDFDVIYHAAAMKHVAICELSPVEAAKTNILGTQNVVDAAVHCDIPKMITISTDKAIYPTNVMGATKFIAEKITLTAGYSCVRFGNVANSRGSVIPVFIENILHGQPLSVSSLEVTRFLMQLSDAVKLVIEASQYCQGGDVFVLKMKAFQLGDLVDVLRKMPPLKSVDVRIGGLTPGEKLHEDLLDETELDRVCEINDMYCVLPFGAGVQQKMKGYSSQDVELLSQKELEKIVREYLDMKKRGDVHW